MTVEPSATSSHDPAAEPAEPSAPSSHDPAVEPAEPSASSSHDPAAEPATEPAGPDVDASDTPRPALWRVHPAAYEAVTIADAYRVERRPHARRPWVGLCMVSSLDGTVAVDGTSGALGNPNDLEVLLTLRSITDVVVVGAGTVRGEGYGPPKTAGQRIGVVTNRGSVDLDDELFTSGAGFVITTERAEVDEDRVQVLRVGAEHVDLGVAFERLHEIVPDVRYVQAEGGPTLNAALLDADLIDELDLTIASRLSGGAGPRLTDGADEIDRRFDLAHLLVDDDGFVFGRWTRRR